MGHIANRKRRTRRVNERECSHVRNRRIEFERMENEKICFDLLNDMFNEDNDDIQKMNNKLVEPTDELSFNTSKISNDKSLTRPECDSSRFVFTYKDDTHNFDFSHQLNTSVQVD